MNAPPWRSIHVRIPIASAKKRRVETRRFLYKLYTLDAGYSLFFLDRGYRRDQHTPDCTAVSSEWLICLICKEACFMQQIEPVLAFIAFLQRNLQFGDKILRPLCVLRLVNIGANARPAT